jgi:hypothetical protein
LLEALRISRKRSKRPCLVLMKTPMLSHWGHQRSIQFTLLNYLLQYAILIYCFLKALSPDQFQRIGTAS